MSHEDHCVMTYDELYEAHQICYESMCRWENNYNDLKKKYLRQEKFIAELKQNIANGDVNSLVYLDKCQELENEIEDLHESLAVYQRNEQLDIRECHRLKRNLLLTLATYADYIAYHYHGSVVSDNLKKAERKHRQAELFRKKAGEV